MESLLHWDFSPGLAIESQVRDKFQSTVHFSPANPRSAKEFFLVVSFSSASFPLTEESVALALQSCIGGISSGFRLLRLSDHRFRFSVASNRVGHFSMVLRIAFGLISFVIFTSFAVISLVWIIRTSAGM
mgnify:CR=1 FL=1